jgi:uncharacterized flavoprotein (TIGR03862 family)
MTSSARPRVAVIGGGPAGLIAAERLAGDCDVTVYERMPGLGRKFLMAGRGGLNLTHSEQLPAFVARYREAAPRLAAAIEAFPPDALRAWCEALGQPTFVGTSGRVFPTAMKASPLLRAWTRRLDAAGVRFAMRHTWRGWDADDRLLFDDAHGARIAIASDATVLALGGASWPRLGADGAWTALLAARGIAIRALRPANCGLRIDWSDYIRGRFAGTPLKRIAIAFHGESVRGEAIVTATGIEGGAAYALSAPVRDALDAGAPAEITLDLRPDLTHAALTARLGAPRRTQSLASFLRKAAAVPPLALALLHEIHGAHIPEDPARLAAALKAVKLRVTGVAPLDRAISSAGGIAWGELDEMLMLRKLPGVFACGEMIDWEAPTGGYLLQACFATGALAAAGVRARLT